MSNVAVALRDITYHQTEAQVVRREGERYVVRTARNELTVERATSCLVDPDVDDLVLLAMSSDNRAYVLAVLERTGDATECRVAGDLHLRVDGGSFTVVAEEGVELVTPKKLTLLAAEVGARAVVGDVWFERLAYAGTQVKAEVERVKTTVSTLDQVLDRWSQRVKRAYRRVEELEHLRAGQIDYAAEEMLRVHGQNSVITAEKLVKVDGEQIHLG
jgi:hypothetical protein